MGIRIATKIKINVNLITLEIFRLGQHRNVVSCLAIYGKKLMAALIGKSVFYENRFLFPLSPALCVLFS